MVDALPGLATLNDFFQLSKFFGHATAVCINKSFLFKIKGANVCEMLGYHDSYIYIYIPWVTFMIAVYKRLVRCFCVNLDMKTFRFFF